MARCSDHLLVIGTSQVGKTTLLREVLLPEAPRFVVLDPQGIYSDLDGQVRDPRAAGRQLKDAATGPLELVLTHPEHEVHLAAARLLYRLHEAQDRPPTVLLMDEAHTWSDPSQIPDAVLNIYSTALQHGILAVSVTQFPQMISKKVRNLSGCAVAMRVPEGSLTHDLAARFRHAEDRLPRLEKLQRGRGDQAARGTHYETYPADLDLLAWWRGQVRAS